MIVLGAGRSIAAILAGSVAFSALLAACGGTNSGPVLTDPIEIIDAGLAAAKGATSVQLDGTVDGVVPVALPGSAAATEVDLTGTTVSADLDLANGNAQVKFSIPRVLGLAGELIVVDGTSYLRSTLTGQQYQVIDLGTVLPIDPTDATGMFDTLGDFLLTPGVDPTKGDDVACGGKQCYTVVVDLTADELGTIIGSGAASLPVDLAGATLKMTVRIQQETPNFPAGVSVAVGLASGQTLALELTFSQWDSEITISPPPSDQIKPG